jgi:hypothetical protein
MGQALPVKSVVLAVIALQLILERMCLPPFVILAHVWYNIANRYN